MVEARSDCGRPFDESLLTGYLDGVLTQEDAQGVRIHLEDCGTCRELMEDLEMMRKTTMGTQFSVPDDDQWDERPRGTASGFASGVGWTMLLLWVVGIAGFALGQLWSSAQGALEKLLIFGGLSGGALLFLSVLIDRLRARETDRYRRVKK